MKVFVDGKNLEFIFLGVFQLQVSQAKNEFPQNSNKLTFTGREMHTGTSLIQMKVTYGGILD